MVVQVQARDWNGSLAAPQIGQLEGALTGGFAGDPFALAIPDVGQTAESMLTGYTFERSCSAISMSFAYPQKTRSMPNGKEKIANEVEALKTSFQYRQVGIGVPGNFKHLSEK